MNDKEYDGDVVIESNIDLNTLGDYSVSYSYKNKKVARVVKVVDTEAPEIKLEKDKYEIYVGDSFVVPKPKVVDNYDGDLTDKVEVTGSVDSSKSGEYILVYSVVDSSGNEANSRLTVLVKKKAVANKPVKPDKPGVGSNYNGSCKVGDGISSPVRNEPDFLSSPKTPNNSKNEVMCMTFMSGGIAIDGINDTSISILGLMDNRGNIVSEIA